MSMKNSSDTMGNRTHNIAACSAVPHPIAPPRAPLVSEYLAYYATRFFMIVFTVPLYLTLCRVRKMQHTFS
jgi:hypothetical protein